jgi:hypothetical protein
LETAPNRARKLKHATAARNAPGMHPKRAFHV